MASEVTAAVLGAGFLLAAELHPGFEVPNNQPAVCTTHGVVKEGTRGWPDYRFDVKKDCSDE